MAEVIVMKCATCQEYLYRTPGNWEGIVKCKKCGWEWRMSIIKVEDLKDIVERKNGSF